MAMSVSPDEVFALTVSADHILVRYNLDHVCSSIISKTAYELNMSIGIKHGPFFKA